MGPVLHETNLKWHDLYVLLMEEIARLKKELDSEADEKQRLNGVLLELEAEPDG